MKTLWIALLSVSACASAPCIAQDTPSSSQSLQLSKVVVDTETNPIEARVKGGTLCVFPSHIEMPKEKKTQDHERFDGLFSGEMKKRGFTVVSSAGDLFASESSEKGNFLVGATVTPTEINICSSVNGYKGTIKVNVEWQIYNRSTQSVVETVSTSGEGTLAKFSNSGYEEMWNLAFVNALQRLAEQNFFHKHVGEPVPAQVAGGSAAVAATN